MKKPNKLNILKSKALEKAATKMIKHVEKFEKLKKLGKN